MSRPVDTKHVDERLESMPVEVREVFDRCETGTRADLLALRDLVLSTAVETDGVGAISECLKWGEPAYVTSETGSGSTIRIAPTGTDSSHGYAMYFICRTDLLDTFKSMFGERFDYGGSRALLFRSGDALPVVELRACIELALTYHQRATAE